MVYSLITTMQILPCHFLDKCSVMNPQTIQGLFERIGTKKHAQHRTHTKPKFIKINSFILYVLVEAKGFDNQVYFYILFILVFSGVKHSYRMNAIYKHTSSRVVIPV